MVIIFSSVSILYYSLVLLFFTVMYLRYLDIWVGYNWYIMLCDSITACTYFMMPNIRQCMASYSIEYYAFFMISEMLTCMFLLLGIIFLNLFGKLHLVNGRLCHFGWAQLPEPRVFTSLSKTILFFWWFVLGFMWISSASSLPNSVLLLCYAKTGTIGLTPHCSTNNN